jgi:CheY-like chemotaxis protein
MQNLTVLVVEDEWLLAEDLKEELESLGCKVLGPAPSCAAALELLFRDDKPGLAYVDTQLGTETCEAVLEECKQLRIPVVISTGHHPRELPTFATGLPLLSKPHSRAELEDSLRAATAG